MFIVVNQPYYVPYTIPYNFFKFSTVLLVTEHRVTQRVTLSWINRWLFLEAWAWAACGDISKILTQVLNIQFHWRYGMS